MKDMILFSQAPADIQYLISLYDQHKSSYNIHIVVVNVENNYKFFQSLNLDAKLSFVPLIGQKEILKFLFYSVKLKLVYQNLFSLVQNAEVYFFSNNYDYVTAFFVEKLSKKNQVYFHDIYHIDGKTVDNNISKIKKIIIKILFGIKVRFFELPPSIAYQYDFNRKIIKKIDFHIKDKYLENYKYSIGVIKKEKSLLFFESNGEIDESFTNYKQDLVTVLNVLSLQYNIYIKPHPRLGYSSLLNDFDIKTIPDFIPSELIQTNDFSLVLGIDSASIATVRHANRYSLLKLFEFRDVKRKEYLKEYLSNLADGKLKFIDGLDEIK